MKYLTLIVFLLSGWVSGQSDIEIEGPVPDVYSIEDIVRSLEGQGVIIKNVKSNQPDNTSQIGHFTDDSESILMNEGMIISTGSVHGISQPNQSSGYTGAISNIEYDTISYDIRDSIAAAKYAFTGRIYKADSFNIQKIIPKAGQVYADSQPDSDLSKMLSGLRTYDACAVEFDLIPLGDTLNFKYLFGSEEYDEFVGSTFNDAFAFFISGPGIDGTKNLAVINDSIIVSINSINDGNPGNPSIESCNPSFYNRNTGQIPLEYDGFTRTLNINQAVVPYETYHLKIVIADASDQALDSGVLIEGSSIISYDRKFTIPFQEDAYNLTKQTTRILDKLISVVEENPEYVLEVSGHTDSDGEDDYNIKLSKERSQGVVQYLLDKGVDDDRFVVLNKGESVPIATNNTAEGRQANRRVEVKVIPSYEVKEDEIIANEFNYILKQNFPNPSKDETTVKAEIQDGDIAAVALYSLTGALIHQEDLQDGQVQFDTRELKQGIYVYSLIVNGKPEKTKRMVVTR